MGVLRGVSSFPLGKKMRFCCVYGSPGEARRKKAREFCDHRIQADILYRPSPYTGIRSSRFLALFLLSSEPNEALQPSCP